MPMNEFYLLVLCVVVLYILTISYDIEVHMEDNGESFTFLFIIFAILFVFSEIIKYASF